MSGHSKWHNIQARKGEQDAIRSNQFSKIAKLITIAAKGGGDPAANFSLRLAIDKAKTVGMPKDNIDRAVKKGTGEIVDGAQIEEVLYECYGPGGVAILIKALTDNKNRTVSDLKRIFNENGGSMASVGSVIWMFGQWGAIIINKEQLTINKIERDNFELALIEAGVEDIAEEDKYLLIKTKVENFLKVLNKIRGFGCEIAESGLQWMARDKIKIDDEMRVKLEKLFEKLEENEDVDDYYTNAE